MASVSGPTLRHTLVLAAPPVRVFAALTEARHLERWFCDRCTSETHIAGALVMRWARAGDTAPAFEARWIAWDPPNGAAFTGGHAGYPDGTAGTVRYTLTPSDDGGTSLEVAHETPASEAHAAALASWREAWPRALDRLCAYLAPASA